MLTADVPAAFGSFRIGALLRAAKTLKARRRDKGTKQMTTAANIPLRFQRAPPTELATHLYNIGQAVRLTGGFLRTGDIYLITAKLPPVGDSPQYRIRNNEERFERVATQASLEPVATPPRKEAGAFIEKPLDLASPNAPQPL